MKFSVIIVNYASWPLTLRCVESLRKTGREDFEIVIVDNESLEPPPAVPASVIRNRRNRGFARACNQGTAASAGELLVFLNPDSLVRGDFFERAEEFFEEHPSVGIAGPRILDGDGQLQLSARKEINPLSGLLGRTSLLTRLFPNSSFVRSQFPAVRETGEPAAVDWVSGACMIARRQTLMEVGPWDERFFMYFEDADLCRRARLMGWPVYYVPRIEVVHHAGGSTRSRPRAVWLLHRSAFLYHRKHGAHGPLGLYSLGVLAGLAARALVRLAALRLSAARRRRGD